MAWQAAGGGTCNQIKIGKLTTAHFQKDAWSRMRVKLAVQVLSSSTKRLLQQCIVGRLVPVEDHNLESLIELCGKVALNYAPWQT